MIRKLFTVVGLLVAASTAACSANVSEKSASQSANISEVEANASVIVWAQAQDKVTQYLSDSGAIVSHRVGVELAVGSSILRLKTSSSDAALECTVNYGNGEQDQSGKYSAWGLSLASAAGLPEQEMVPLMRMPADNEYSSLRQSADVTGTVGPYVFIREIDEEMGCGAAHPGTGVKSIVWDASRGAPVEMRFAPELLANKAREAFAVMGNAATATDDVKLVEIVPRFDKTGHLSLAYRFERSACYACGDRIGNDYTVSVTVEGSSVDAPLPSELQPYENPPPALTAYLAAYPGTPVNGWSTIGR